MSLYSEYRKRKWPLTLNWIPIAIGMAGKLSMLNVFRWYFCSAKSSWCRLQTPVVSPRGPTMTHVRARKPGALQWLQSPSRRLFKIRINRYPPLKVHQKNGLEWKLTFTLTHSKLPSLLLVSGWMPTSNRPADKPVKSLFPEHLAPNYCDLILLFTLLTNA